jgi:hypothetical protein
MPGLSFFNTHRTWEDWFGMALGMLIVLSPWLTGETNHGLGAESEPRYVILATLLIGIVVFCLAQMEYISLRRWEEGCEMALGLCLIAMPYFLGYSGDGALRFWHTGLGGAVVLLAVLKLWQDWDLTDQELTGHGQ